MNKTEKALLTSEILIRANEYSKEVNTIKYYNRCEHCYEEGFIEGANWLLTRLEGKKQPDRATKKKRYHSIT